MQFIVTRYHYERLSGEPGPRARYAIYKTEHADFTAEPMTKKLVDTGLSLSDAKVNVKKFRAGEGKTAVDFLV